MGDNEDQWKEWSKLIIYRLEKAEAEREVLGSKISELKTKITIIETKATMISVVSGGIASAIIAFVMKGLLN